MARVIEMKNIISIIALLFFQLWLSFANADVRLKEISRIEGVRENAVVGYGIVAGLAGTGDSPRSEATMQSVTNALRQFGVTVSRDDINSRNVAAVIVTSKLPPFVQVGDLMDVSVSSLGDARSLVGGTLLMTPLKAANDKVYMLAQGQVSVGGFKYDLNGNVLQKNHPTVGLVPQGGIVERDTFAGFLSDDNTINLLLTSPDFTTANRVENALNRDLGGKYATALHAGKISVKLPEASYASAVSWITRIENVRLNPDRIARVVINERTGTVVSGGNVVLDDVTISHGNIKVIISTDFSVSQPSFVRGVGNGVRSIVVPDTEINVQEDIAKAIDLSSGATINDLVTSLQQIKTSTRDVITILQAINAAGALHAKLIIQ